MDSNSFEATSRNIRASSRARSRAVNIDAQNEEEAKESLIHSYGSLVGVRAFIEQLQGENSDLEENLSVSRTTAMSLSKQLRSMNFDSMTDLYASDICNSTQMERDKKVMTIDRLVEYRHANHIVEHDPDIDEPMSSSRRPSFLNLLKTIFQKAQRKVLSLRSSSSSSSSSGSSSTSEGDVGDAGALVRRINKCIVYVLDAACTAASAQALLAMALASMSWLLRAPPLPLTWSTLPYAEASSARRSTTIYMTSCRRGNNLVNFLQISTR
jgi:hypothetical protein